MSHGKKSKRKKRKKQSPLERAEADEHLNKRSPQVEITGHVETNFPPDLVGRYDTASEKEEGWNHKRFVAEIVGAILLAVSVGTIGWQGSLLRESNKINRDALQSVQRAFVRWTGFRTTPALKRSPSGQDQRWWLFENTWENSGNTTATEVVQYFEVDELAVEPNDEKFRGKVKASDLIVSVIGPRGTTQSGTIEKPESFIYGLRPDLSHTIESNQRIFFWGWIVYRDVFANTKPHVTEICMELAGVTYPKTAMPQKGFIPVDASPGLRFSGCHDHNCVDNYCKNYQSLASLTPQ
jgi:hypothetical protein